MDTLLKSYKTTTRGGEQYYAEGPYSGKKVGTVRGQGQKQVSTDGKSATTDTNSPSKAAHAQEALSMASRGDWDSAWEHAQKDESLNSDTKKEDWVKWAKGTEHFKSLGGDPKTGDEHLKADKEKAKADAGKEVEKEAPAKVEDAGSKAYVEAAKLMDGIHSMSSIDEEAKPITLLYRSIRDGNRVDPKIDAAVERLYMNPQLINEGSIAKLKGLIDDHLGAKETPMKKSLSEQIEAKAESLAKALQPIESKADQSMEPLQKALASLSKDQLKALVPSLSKAEKVLLGELLQKGKPAVSFDKEYAAEYVKGKVTDTVIQEDKADDDQDEKLVKKEAAAHKHQGDQTPEGREDHIVKAQSPWEEIAKSEDLSYAAIKKMCGRGMTSDQIQKMCMTKGFDESKVSGMIDRAMQEHGGDNIEKGGAGSRGGKVIGHTKSGKPIYATGAAEYSKDFDKQDHNDANNAHAKAADEVRASWKSGKGDGDSSGHQEAARHHFRASWEAAYGDRPAVVKKSFAWASTDQLLKANTQGRNHHFNVGDYFEGLAKAQANVDLLQKSLATITPAPEELGVNDFIELGMDASRDSVIEKSRIRETLDQQNGALVKSFSDEDLAKSMGLDVEGMELLEKGYKTKTMGGVQYYAEGPYSGKKVGSVRGKGQAKAPENKNSSEKDEWAEAADSVKIDSFEAAGARFYYVTVDYDGKHYHSPQKSDKSKIVKLAANLKRGLKSQAGMVSLEGWREKPRKSPTENGKPTKSAAAQMALKHMDNEFGGNDDGSYSSAVKYTMDKTGISREQLDKELEPFI